MIRRADEQPTEIREKMRGGPGAVSVRHFLSKDDFAASVRLCARLTLPPGSGIGTHQHSGEDEVYIVI